MQKILDTPGANRYIIACIPKRSLVSPRGSLLKALRVSVLMFLLNVIAQQAIPKKSVISKMWMSVISEVDKRKIRRKR